MSLPNTFKQKVVMERLISRACFASSETLKHASVSFLSFFFVCVRQKGNPYSPRPSLRRPWKQATDNILERHACFARKAEEILMRKMSSFSGTGPSTNSIA